jgi:hypothetical protein
MAHVNQSGTPVLLSSSGVVSLSGGDMIGYHVNSTTGGTIVIRDGSTSGSSAVSGTITPSIGFQAFPGAFPTGCYATLANTISVTFFFAAG